MNENSTTLKYWSIPPTTIYRKFYLFNLTNHKEFLKGNKPILREHGPYTYRDTNVKKNLKFIPSNKISYQPQSTLYFEPSMSVEDGIFYLLNIPAVAAKSGSDTFLKNTASEIISGVDSNFIKIHSMLTQKKDTKFSLANKVKFKFSFHLKILFQCKRL